MLLQCFSALISTLSALICTFLLQHDGDALLPDYVGCVTDAIKYLDHSMCLMTGQMNDMHQLVYDCQVRVHCDWQ